MTDATVDDEAVALGRRLRRLRSSQGMSLDTLVGLAGLTTGFLSTVERGRLRLSRRVDHDRLAAALGVSIGDVIGDPSIRPRPGAEAIPTLRRAWISRALDGPAAVALAAYSRWPAGSATPRGRATRSRPTPVRPTPRSGG